MKQRRIRGVLTAAAVTLVIGAGALKTIEYKWSDRFYQERSASSGQIVLIGIDDRALEDIGPYQFWGRDIMAMTLEALNASEELHPAVIGLDILYTGASDPETDRWLAEAAGRYDNVVTACAVEFGTQIETGENGEQQLVRDAITAVELPYEALAEASSQGLINAMLDEDGILRHHLLQVELPNGGLFPSLALKIAEKYRETMGETALSLPPVKGRGFWYLPFTGNPGDYWEDISVADVISGAVGPEYFDGKIVLIGPYATGLQDSYFTSMDHARPMYGVEIQANAIEALLRGEYKTEVSDAVQLAVLFLILSCCAVVFLKLSMERSTVLWLAAAGLALLVCRWLGGGGYLLHVTWLPVGITVLYIGCIAVNYVRTLLEKRKIQNTFQRYVAPEIVDELLKEGTDALQLGGKSVEIAVLFVDIRGFTTMSECLTPGEVVNILNDYLTLIADCIMRNHGTLDKFIGDCAMAFWGAPLPQEDFVMNALKAAMDMAKGAEQLSSVLREKYGRTVSFGIGVNVGEAVVGNIGSPNRMDYTAIGDTVNTASRLEANAPGGTIYISRAVADKMGDRIRTTSLGDSIRLKGKKEGFEVLILEEIRMTDQAEMDRM